MNPSVNWHHASMVRIIMYRCVGCVLHKGTWSKGEWRWSPAHSTWLALYPLGVKNLKRGGSFFKVRAFINIYFVVTWILSLQSLADHLLTALKSVTPMEPEVSHHTPLQLCYTAEEAVGLAFRLCHNYTFYCCDKTPWSKATWGEKGLFHLTAYSLSWKGSQRRGPKLEPKKKLWRNPAYWLVPSSFPSLLSYTTQDHLSFHVNQEHSLRHPADQSDAGIFSVEGPFPR